MNKKSEDLLNVPTDRRMFRDRLIAKMRERSLSAPDLARKAKVSRDAIGTYTTMRSLPTPATLGRLATALGCKPEDLIPVKPVSESLLELHDHPKAGYKVLVVKMPLPTMEAMQQYKVLAKLEEEMAARNGQRK